MFTLFIVKNVSNRAGIVFLLAAAASLAAGALFKETALLVFGPLLLALLGYCLGACLITAAVCRKWAAFKTGTGVEFAPSVIAVGEKAAVLFAGKGARFWTPPAILVRYLIRLETRDGRIQEKVFPKDFFTGTSAAIVGEKRGAYFGKHDYLFIGDVFGFFKTTVKIAARDGERLCVYPAIKRERPTAIPCADGSGQTVQTALVPNDDLTEQRPYVPGDDPRRINWKLYGHSEELFVREGEKRGEPLPEITVIIDTLTDKKDKRETADDLCRRALELTVAAARSASSVTVHYRGGGEAGRRWTHDMDKRALYALFALPFAATDEKAARGSQDVSPPTGVSATPFMTDACPSGKKNAVIVVRDA
ncbi:MAG: DUF58 domain-containing protein [Spirochaetaceae bacterium]|jgi:uncharacterized protein (DUF58 family)|nr:DUF58 domain-containing protein [Spirochaetaceae bacterium]